MFDVIPKQLYEAVYAELNGSNDLTYFSQIQRGFFPKSADIIHPSLYPWLFIEFGGYSTPEIVRMPRVWGYVYTIYVVMLTLADKGDPTNLVFNDGSADNPGIGDIAGDVCAVLWKRHNDAFGLKVLPSQQDDGVLDWGFGTTGPPGVFGVQSLLVNPFVRGIQTNLLFQVIERDSVG